MVYSRDQWIQLPVRDLYDSQIMLASINAAKDMYQQGVNEFKEYQKNYNDFYSPISRDMDWYNKNVIGSTQDLIKDLYDRGIDPLRSPEGRAMLQRHINNIPTQQIGKLKASAIQAQKYLDSISDLAAKGLYNEDYERFNNPYSPDDWDTMKNGVWNRSSAMSYKNLQQYVHPTFEGIKPHLLTKEEVESRGMKYDPNYEYQGISEKDMRDSLQNWMPGLKGDPLYIYHRNQAKLDLQRAGIQNPTEDQIDRRFMDNAIIADHQVATPLAREADKFALKRQDFNNDMALAKAKAAMDLQKDMALENLRNQHENARIRLKAYYDGIKNQNKDAKTDIFYDARTHGNTFIGYQPKDSYNLKIDPVSDGLKANVTKNGNFAYSVPASKAGEVFFSHKDIYNGGKRVYVVPRNKKNLMFAPSGEIHAVNHGKEKGIKYYISGYLYNGNQYKDDKGNIKTDYKQNKSGDGLYMIEVKERPSAYKDNRYGKK